MIDIFLTLDSLQKGIPIKHQLRFFAQKINQTLDSIGITSRIKMITKSFISFLYLKYFEKLYQRITNYTNYRIRF